MNSKSGENSTGIITKLFSKGFRGVNKLTVATNIGKTTVPSNFRVFSWVHWRHHCVAKKIFNFFFLNIFEVLQLRCCLCSVVRLFSVILLQRS